MSCGRKRLKIEHHTFNNSSYFSGVGYLLIVFPVLHYWMVFQSSAWTMDSFYLIRKHKNLIIRLSSSENTFAPHLTLFLINREKEKSQPASWLWLSTCSVQSVLWMPGKHSSPVISYPTLLTQCGVGVGGVGKWKKKKKKQLKELLFKQHRSGAVCVKA